MNLNSLLSWNSIPQHSFEVQLSSIELTFSCPPFWSSIAYQVNDVLPIELEINYPPSWSWINSPLSSCWCWINLPCWSWIIIFFNHPPFLSSIAYQVKVVLPTEPENHCPPTIWNWSTHWAEVGLSIELKFNCLLIWIQLPIKWKLYCPPNLSSIALCMSSGWSWKVLWAEVDLLSELKPDCPFSWRSMTHSFFEVLFPTKLRLYCPPNSS
jgi:hypothetical protein